MNPITIAQAAYMAGVVDGEGHIGVTLRQPNHQRSQRIPYYMPVVKVTNTDLYLLEWLQTRTSLGTISSCGVRKGTKWCYVWFLRMEEQVDFLVSLLPYLIVKSEQARLLIEFHSIRDIDPDYIMQHTLYEELVSLNH